MAKEYLGEQTLAKLISMISAQFKKYPAPDQVADKQYVDEEIATFDFIKIVPELPETGLVNRTYFVPKTSSETNDLYDEYMWINDDWEYRGSKQIEVDLTEYVKKTDYASDSKHGVVKVSHYRGMKVLSGGIITLMAPTDTQIDTRNNGNDVSATTAVTLSQLDYAIKKGLTTNSEPLTDEEKAAAQEWLGVTAPRMVPEASSTDDGKFLRVVDGAPAWVELTDVSEVGA